MPMSVRLDRQTESLIRRVARMAGRSKSWVVREAVAAYASVPSGGRSPYEALSPFIGAGGTGLTNLSERTGERFTDLVRTKEASDRREAPRRGARERWTKRATGGKRRSAARAEQRARRPR